MTSKPKHSHSPKAGDSSDEVKYKTKYQELKKRVHEIEKFNEGLVIKISRVKKNVRRTKVERKLENVKGENEHDSEAETNSESEVEQVERPTPKKTEKDPNAPKRPSNSFFVFCQLERSKLKEIHQDASLSELTKMLGQRWKVMTMEEKKKYYDISAQDKQRYEREMCTYNGTVYQPSAESKETIESPFPVVSALLPEDISKGANELETIDSKIESESNMTVSEYE